LHHDEGGLSVRFRGRELLSVLFASAIVIACSKKSPPAPAPPSDVSSTASASATPPDTATTPSAAPQGSVVSAPTATATTIVPPPVVPVAPAEPNAEPKTTDLPPKNKAGHTKKPAKHSGRGGDSDLDDLKQAQIDGELDREKKAPAPPPPPQLQPAKPATKPAPTTTTTAKVEEKADEKPSQPAGTALKRSVTVTTASHYACTTKDLKESVSVLSETRGARITIGGQGPCPGEIKERTAEVADKRVDVHGTHGAQSKCTCAGTGDMVLRGLEPGTYDVHVNGGFNRPIAVRVVVGSP